MNLVGNQFGRLWIIKFDRMDKYGHSRWIAYCECGKLKTVTSNKLLLGKTRSCGCLQKDVTSQLNKVRATHRDIKSPEYKCWASMIQRCYNPKHDNFVNYGGRGIEVCSKWRESYLRFLEDVGRKPTLQHSIDRINGNGNYEPGNVRWATRSEQEKNKSRGRRDLNP